MTYTDDNRGVIQFRERRKQLIDCSGLRIGKITPTDCDGLIEYHGRAYVLFELKFRDAEVPRGQLIALVRAIDDWRQARKFALLIIAEHDVENPAEDINAAKCTERTFYFEGIWYTPPKPVTLKERIDRFIDYVNRRNSLEQRHHDGQSAVGTAESFRLAKLNPHGADNEDTHNAQRRTNQLVDNRR